MCETTKGIRDLRHEVAEKVLSLTDIYTVDEIVEIVCRECNISEKQKEYALSAIEDVLDIHGETIPFTDKYRIV